MKEVLVHVKSVHALKQHLVDGWQVLHPPNEEAQDARRLAKLMAMGMLPGAPDLIVFSPEGKAHFLEFKSENGALSEAQERFQLWAIRANLPHSVVRSVEQALKVFQHWGAMRAE